MISINYNPSVLRAQNNLSKANNAMGVALQRMSTGYKINSAADDAAGLYIATGLNTQIRGLKQAQKNVSTGKSILSIAEGSLNNMSNMLNRVRDLALQGANSYYSADSRGALQNEADKLLAEVTRIKKSTNFNGLNLFDGSSESQTASAASVSTFSTPPKAAMRSAARAAAVSNDTVPEGYTAIYTAEDLNNIRNDLSGKYILMNDIDLSSIDNWQSIGTIKTIDADLKPYGESFTGILDGNGHTIKNLKSTQQGLFACIDHAEIKNLNIENIQIECKTDLPDEDEGLTGPAGGVAGAATNSKITNCKVIGDISGQNKRFDAGSLSLENTGSGMGGIIGVSVNNTIDTCSFSGNICVGYMGAGGIVGLSGSDTITGCSNTGTITGYLYIGGLAGQTVAGNISNCFNTGEVFGVAGIGGLVGFCQDETITNCYNTGSTSAKNISGIENNEIAQLIGYISDDVTINNVWAKDNGSGYPAITKNDSTNSIITNTDVLSDSEFNSAAPWADFDDNIWDKSTYPPTPKAFTPNTPDNPDSPTPSTGAGNIRLQVGANSDVDSNAIFIDITFDLKDLSVDFSDAESCVEAVKTVDKYLKEINDKMAYIGATQNRLDSVAQSQITQIENFTAAKSTIMDADIAQESAEFTKQQILTQTTSALLVQANRLNANTAMSLIDSLR